MSMKPFVRIFPFALFMGFIALEQFASWLQVTLQFPINAAVTPWLYPLKAISVALAIYLLRKNYCEWQIRDLRRLRETALSIGAGIMIFVLWINMDWTGFASPPPTGFNPNVSDDPALRALLIISRLFGAVLVVPIMEELFWRSFLLRYLIDRDFTRIAVGFFSWPSFLLSSLLFGLEHHYILAGIMAGIVFNLLLYKTRSIAQCTLSHAVANLALGIYVLQSDQWRFW